MLVETSGAHLASSSALGGERSDGAVGEKRERADGSVSTVNDVYVSRVGGPSEHAARRASVRRSHARSDHAAGTPAQAWLEQSIESGACGNVSGEAKARVLASVRENEIDREVLATLTEADLLQTLGLTVLGQRFATQARAKHFRERALACVQAHARGARTASR